MAKKLVITPKGQNLVDLTPEEEARCIAKKAEWETGYFDRAIAQLRLERNNLLAQTDFYALQDVTMSEAMTNYRQALRDLPSGLTTVEEVKAANYPMKPGS